MRILGREKEQEKLRAALEKEESQLIAVYGRRRVGKTFLIENTLSKEIVFDVIGIKKATIRTHLTNFRTQIVKRSKRFRKSPIPQNWFDAFQLLQEYIESKKAKKKVIYIDEFPWFCSQRSEFLPVFEHFWNSFCAKRNDIVVVVCGSAASFMVNNIIYNKDGLHGRISTIIRLMPFNLYETKEYLRYKKINWDHYDIVQCYMILGGIPHYLNQLDRRYTLPQNIDKLFFESGGQLINEFDQVLLSLFSNSSLHKSIITELAKKRIGLSRKALNKNLGKGNNRTFSKAIKELEESGFIVESSSFDQKETKSLFRLNDEFCFFYLKYIEPNKGQGDGTWLQLFNSRSFDSWSGFAFEMLCMKHTLQIKKALGIPKVRTTTHSWISKEAQKSVQKSGAQIDMLLKRQDRRIDLIEMKFYNKPYSITKSYRDQIINKRDVFEEEANSKDALALIMITTKGLKKNTHSNILTEHFTIDVLFKKDY
jgi:AAA+ ATPase superfamily predicted ATPase